MKTLKIIGIALLLVVLILIGIGSVVNSFEYGNSINVKESSGKCWQVFADTTLRKKWINGLTSYTLMEGTSFETGAIYRTTIVDGETMVMFEKIVKIDPGKFIALHLTNDVLTSDYSYSFEGDSTQTRISTQYLVRGNNVFMRAVLALSKSYLAKSDAEMLDRLKHEIESKY